MDTFCHRHSRQRQIRRSSGSASGVFLRFNPRLAGVLPSRTVFRYLTAAILATGIVTLAACSGSDSDSTSGVTLEKPATDESGVTTITEETHLKTDQRRPGSGEAPSNVQSAGGLTVISPNGGEEWVPGKAYEIRWNKGTSLPHAAITIYPGSKGSGYEYIVAKTENDGSYTWKIPSSFRTGSGFRIYVESFSYHHACTDYSFLNQGYNYSYLITRNKDSNEAWQETIAVLTRVRVVPATATPRPKIPCLGCKGGGVAPLVAKSLMSTATTANRTLPPTTAPINTSPSPNPAAVAVAAAVR